MFAFTYKFIIQLFLTLIKKIDLNINHMSTVKEVLQQVEAGTIKLEEATKIICGSAKSMGIEVKK